MSTRRNVPPLTINTRSNANPKNGVVTASATITYTEPTTPGTARKRSSISHHTRQSSVGRSSAQHEQAMIQTTSMNGYSGNATSPPGMYVRALYDYVADDKTSLSFRQGDVIQVITQLESGWWDGIIDSVRGWFPSNYCAVVTGPLDQASHEQHSANGHGDTLGESGTEDEYEEEPDVDEASHDHSGHSRYTNTEKEQEEAAYWVPQATTDGRLYYYNTLTGISKAELPLETPTSANETGPRDRMNIRVPDQTRPPPEMMAGGYSQDEDDTDVSEAESIIVASRGSLQRRRSYISDGLSPALSMDSLNASPMARSRDESLDFSRGQRLGKERGAANAATTSFTGNSTPFLDANIPSVFSDDDRSRQVTWNRLVENMAKAIETYRQAINNADRSEYVRMVEDISDHLRLLLVAGSRTTDNHSGNPSIISTNKALYPHFRDMMSRFSKLVLSSHIASADWPAPDSYSKCLVEAQGVLRSVHNYIEVARSQCGEDIPRLLPGFALGPSVGGSWQNNSIESLSHRPSSTYTDSIDDYDILPEPAAKLDQHLLDRMEELKRMVVQSLRRLDEQCVVHDKLITPTKHERISNSICSMAGKVIEFFRPYISTVESINLASLGSPSDNPQLVDFSNQKQKLYDHIADIVVACQTVAAPLSDEWTEIRGEPLDSRVHEVRNVAKALEATITQVNFSLQLLLESLSRDTLFMRVNNAQSRDHHRITDGGATFHSTHARSGSGQLQRPQLAAVGHSQSFSVGVDRPPEAYRGENEKVRRFFGEVPKRDSEEIPNFLRLDHEAEIAYDPKTTPPTLRGGTLTALVEQLTRHDRLDTFFNKTFLLTYRSFTTANELFEMFVRRFTIQPPQGITPSDFQTWADQKQKLIRVRVVNVMKDWIENFWMENNDQASDDLLRQIYAFSKDTVGATNSNAATPLLKIVEQRLRGQDAAKKLVLTTSGQAPTPVMPKNMKKLKFLDIDATEFARQLTIIESRLYVKIKPTECLDKTWNKKLAPDEPEAAPNVRALILHSNQLTNWVAEMILNQPDVKKRVVVIKHFVSIADVKSMCPSTTWPVCPNKCITEMSQSQQLLYAHLNHLRSWFRPRSPSDQDVAGYEQQDLHRPRGAPKGYGQRQELCRVQRSAARRLSPLHTVFR